MLGDVVCHSWFRKASRKFNSEQKSQLAQLYQPKYIFSVIEHSTLSSIKDAIIEGDLGKKPCLKSLHPMNIYDLKIVFSIQSSII